MADYAVKITSFEQLVRVAEAGLKIEGLPEVDGEQGISVQEAAWLRAQAGDWLEDGRSRPAEVYRAVNARLQEPQNASIRDQFVAIKNDAEARLFGVTFKVRVARVAHEIEHGGGTDASVSAVMADIDDGLATLDTMQEPDQRNRAFLLFARAQINAALAERPEHKRNSAELRSSAEADIKAGMRLVGPTEGHEFIGIYQLHVLMGGIVEQHYAPGALTADRILTDEERAQLVPAVNIVDSVVTYSVALYNGVLQLPRGMDLADARSDIAQLKTLAAEDDHDQLGVFISSLEERADTAGPDGAWSSQVLFVLCNAQSRARPPFDTLTTMVEEHNLAPSAEAQLRFETRILEAGKDDPNFAYIQLATGLPDWVLTRLRGKLATDPEQAQRQIDAVAARALDGLGVAGIYNHEDSAGDALASIAHNASDEVFEGQLARFAAWLGEAQANDPGGAGMRAHHFWAKLGERSSLLNPGLLPLDRRRAIVAAMAKVAATVQPQDSAQATRMRAEWTARQVRVAFDAGEALPPGMLTAFYSDLESLKTMGSLSRYEILMLRIAVSTLVKESHDHGIGRLNEREIGVLEFRIKADVDAVVNLIGEGGKTVSREDVLGAVETMQRLLVWRDFDAEMQVFAFKSS